MARVRKQKNKAEPITEDAPGGMLTAPASPAAAATPGSPLQVESRVGDNSSFRSTYRIDQ